MYRNMNTAWVDLVRGEHGVMGGEHRGERPKCQPSLLGGYLDRRGAHAPALDAASLPFSCARDCVRRKHALEEVQAGDQQEPVPHRLPPLPEEEGCGCRGGMCGCGETTINTAGLNSMG